MKATVEVKAVLLHTEPQQHTAERHSNKDAHRKCHLCNSAEEHLQQTEEEEPRVELTLSYAVGMEVGP